MIARVLKNGLFSSLLWIFCLSGNTEFITKPMDAEVRIGDSTFLNCSILDAQGEVSWYHYPVDEKNTQDRVVYSKGHVLAPYNERFKIDKESSTGSFNLVITQAEDQDAGTYVCQEEKTDRSTAAELIVLGSNPSCSSNNPKGFIGPNDCGLKQDIIQVSCSIKYKGNVAPQLHITRVKEKHYSHANETGLNCSLSKEIGQITCTYNEKTDSDLDGSYFICHINRSKNTQYKCSTDAIKIHYAIGQKSLLAKTVGDSVTCSVKTSSHDCVYTWIWIDDSHAETISQTNRLIINRAGLHQCKANCKIGANECHFDAMMVMASTSIPDLVPVDDSQTNAMIFWCLGTFFLISLCVNAVLLYLYYRYKGTVKDKRQWQLNWEKGQNFDSTEQKNLLPSTPVKMSNTFINENLSYATKFEQIKDIHTRASSVISGLTVLMEKLYVLHEHNSTVEVYDLKTFDHERNIVIKRPSTVIVAFDIASLESNKCLYLAYRTENQLLCEIGKLDIFGNVSHHWSIDDSECRLTMHESNVIVCKTNKNQIAEYSSKGDELVRITLPLDAGFLKVWHAIKIADSKYAVSYTVAESHEHRVSIVERETRVNGHESVKIVYSTSPQMCGMNMPIDLVKFSNDHVLVADKLNNRVLLIDILQNSYKVSIGDGRIKNLKNTCCLEHHPVRMCLDENNGKLIVALGGSYLEVGSICIFRVQDSWVQMDSAESVSYKKELERINEMTTRANKVISGMTLLNKTVYVAYENCSTLDTYDYNTMTFDPKRSLFMNNFLTNPLDIASSELSKCLYIVDLPNRESPCRIKKVSTDGTILKHWFIDDDECRLSVYESNVIACLHHTNQIIDYSSQGETVFRVKLSPGKGFAKLWHAIKVSETQYAVSHTVPQSNGHRVSVIESDENLEVKGNNPRSVRIVYSTSPKFFGMNTPICLVKDGWDRILVAEFLNNRVLLIDPTSNTCEVILRDGRIKNIPTECKCKIEHHPLRLCLDESSEKLLVAMGGSYLKAGVICTFKVQDTQSA